jgi:hypothetical protein
MINEQIFEGRPGKSRRTSSPAPSPRCWKPSTVTAPKASDRACPRPFGRRGGRRRRAACAGGEDRCHATQIARAPQSGDVVRRTTGHPCRNGAMANGRCRMHGGRLVGSPRGNEHALKHAVTALRRLPAGARSQRSFAAMRALACATEEAG